MKWSAGLLTVVATCLTTGTAARQAVVHDETWRPEYVLVATAQNITTNCRSRHSVVFNGTSPGPALYLKEGQTTWVRVYNHLEDKNLTAVGQTTHSAGLVCR